MTTIRYDPVKAHQYYEEHKHLKGRQKGTAETLAKVGGRKVPPRPGSSKQKAEAQARVLRLTASLKKLNAALKAAEQELRNKEEAARKATKQDKTPEQKRQDSKKYYQKHKTQIKEKAKQERATSPKSSSSSGGSGSKSSTTSSTSTHSLSSMSADDLKDRISRIKSLISSTNQQIRAANALAHTMGSDDPHLVHGG